jgi:DNA replication and repair protein RecF
LVSTLVWVIIPVTASEIKAKRINAIIWDVMRLKKLSLRNVRNHKKADFECTNAVAVLGDNGSGKSNMLEAIYMLATGKSYRADSDAEIIRYEESSANLQCTIYPTSPKATLGAGNLQEERTELKITLTDGSLAAARKKCEVNGVPKRMTDFAGQLRAVLFGPWDMDLVTGSPGVRRRYLDFVISQADSEYRRNLVSYEKGLRQRNKLLEQIREGAAVRSQLFFWDKLLIKNGNYITEKRGEYLDALNTPSISPPKLGGESKGEYTAIYDKSVISEQRLLQYETEEVFAGVTLVGPHRDDFKIMQNKKSDTGISTTSPSIPLQNFGEGRWKDVNKYGSRGEQRMAVLWLKEGELDYLTLDNDLPVLLLDDIFSELDHEHRKEVSRILTSHFEKDGQVIMTTADKHMMPAGKEWNIINL